MSHNPANPANCGKRVNDSDYVWQATKLIYEGHPDSRVTRVLAERYGFKVSLPSLMAFHKNYYPTRLQALKESSLKFQQEQSGRIQTFIDESLAQSRQLKNEIDVVSKQLNRVISELDYVHKFDSLFKTAIDQYVSQYDPAAPQEFLAAGVSPEERGLKLVVETMGEQGKLALQQYIATHHPDTLVRLLATLTTKLKDMRTTVVDIHRDIFKSYRNLSISQEMTLIFEKYNGIIIEEFFPNKEQVDQQKFQQVNAKIRALFDELQIRYQGTDSVNHGKGPSEQELQQIAAGAIPEQPIPVVEQVKLRGKPGRPVRSRRARPPVVDPSEVEQEDLTVEQQAQELQQLELADPVKPVVAVVTAATTEEPHA